ncbi:Gag-Pol polyprotein [Gossypium australe]|uniref:Gag-Pol polyprotein n=1 Tax=Gossypium australe TaxID=47621 RepID=A0A5B6VAK7_9ROSI|nr:Gag-Pol polyprotein [Gossypium australe]
MVEYFSISGTKRTGHLGILSSQIQKEIHQPTFVRLGKYARECVYTEGIICKQIEHGLNEDIRLLVGILELKEFLVLVDRACKAEELRKEKRKADFEARDLRKRSMNKLYQSSLEKSWDSYSHPNASMGY